MSAPGGERTIDALTMTLLMVCLGLIAGILVLASQNVRLKKELGSHTVRSADQVELAGLGFPTLALRDATGAPESLVFGEEGALLLIFASNCPDCVATLPDWEELFAGAVDPDSLPVYGIQLDMPPGEKTGSDAGMAKEMPFPVLGAGDEDALKDLRRVPMIPAALFLNPQGVVVESWVGRPTDATLEAMGAFKAPK